MLIAWGSFKVSKDNGDNDEEKRNNRYNEEKEASAEMGANSYMIRFITSSRRKQHNEKVVCWNLRDKKNAPNCLQTTEVIF